MDTECSKLVSTCAQPLTCAPGGTKMPPKLEKSNFSFQRPKIPPQRIARPVFPSKWWTGAGKLASTSVQPLCDALKGTKVPKVGNRAKNQIFHFQRPVTPPKRVARLDNQSLWWKGTLQVCTQEVWAQSESQKIFSKIWKFSWPASCKIVKNKSCGIFSQTYHKTKVEWTLNAAN